MKSARTWILIADAGRAHVYEALGQGRGMKSVDGLMLSNSVPRSRDAQGGAHKPGRGQAAGGVGRHALEPTSDPHRQFKRQFADQVAALLAERLARKEFEKLVVVAPPVMLGDLRAAMPEHVRQVIKAEINKDLTKVPDAELPKHLVDHAPV
jgi:protein required for attachment to host cells